MLENSKGTDYFIQEVKNLIFDSNSIANPKDMYPCDIGHMSRYPANGSDQPVHPHILQGFMGRRILHPYTHKLTTVCIAM